ncbi:transporter [Flavobacterium aquidurense]|uniref:Phenol MetA deg domain containing protein n=1 Tax=Flavobacterium aquidurense TaxID=362413 RepID=A0A0Q0X2Q9_9FLAO|nr:transporter [Flavobacterium aquidurense]KQB42709.1 Phenol MetA deg domain containing protein [Flavobacterium aquidurense]
MKIFYSLTALALFCFSPDILAQQMQTDRPNETEGPNTVIAKHLQIESGFSFEQDHSEHTFEIPELVLRYGIIKNLEVRVETALKISHEDDDNVTGIEPVVIGAKYHIIDHKGAVPDVGVLARVSIPWMADNAYQEKKYSPEIRVLAQHELSKVTRLGYNLGIHWLPDTLQPEYVYTLSADHSITKKIKIFVESYGFAVPQHHAENTVDTGLLFVVNKNVQLDFITGTGIMHANSEKFAEIGLSVRI